jgi:hypothetical protein
MDGTYSTHERKEMGIQKFWWENLKERAYWKELVGKIILTWILKK